MRNRVEFRALTEVVVILAILIAAGGSVKLAAGEVTAPSAARRVPIFDGTLYVDKPDLTQHGLQPIAIVYVSELWRNWHNSSKRAVLPDADRIAAAAHRSGATANIAVLDVEHWPIKGSESAVANSVGKYQRLLRRFRETVPSLKVGYYGVAPIRDYWRAVRGPGAADYLQWQSENDRLAPLAAEMDIVFPSLYTFYNDRHGWVSYAREQIREARRYGKPVYVFLWPQYHDSNRLRGLDYIEPDFWRVQLETVAALADGIVIWGGYGSEWNESAGWWRVTKDFLRSQPD